MISIPIGAQWRPYRRALAESALDVASVGAWVAAAELPPARRRLVRGGIAAVTAVGAIAVARVGPSAADTTGPASPGARSGLPFVDAGIRLPADDPSESDISPRRRAVLAGAVGVAVLTTAVAASVGVAAAGRQLERRWLARLVEHGHPHPHRALGLRMAALYAVLVVPSRVLVARQGAKTGQRDARPSAGGESSPGQPGPSFSG